MYFERRYSEAIVVICFVVLVCFSLFVLAFFFFNFSTDKKNVSKNKTKIIKKLRKTTAKGADDNTQSCLISVLNLNESFIPCAWASNIIQVKEDNF